MRNTNIKKQRNRNIHFISQFDAIKAIEQVVYDKENRKLIVPETKITEVLQVLKDNKINFMYDTRYSDKVDTGKLKVKAKATQTEIPSSQLDDKPKTSKRKLGDGSHN